MLAKLYLASSIRATSDRLVLLANQPKSLIGWIESLSLIVCLLTMLKHCVAPLQWPPPIQTKIRNMLVYQPFPKPPFNMCMIQRNFLPYQVQIWKARPTWPRPVSQILLQTAPFSSDEQPTSSPKTSPNVTPTVDLTALKAEIKQEIKNSLLEEFNVIFHQELAVMHSELQSLCQQPSTDKLSNPKTILILLNQSLLICIQDLKLPLIKCMNPSHSSTTRFFKFTDKMSLLCRSPPRESEIPNLHL